MTRLPVPAVHAAAVALVLVCLAALAPAPAAAQDELQQWLEPKLGSLRARGDFRFQWYPDRPVKGQDADLGWTNYRATGFAPLYQDSANELSVSGSVEYQDMHTKAILPDTREPFPGELWDIRFGAAYRHLFDNGWTAGGSVSIGSPSDEPFASIDEMSFRAMLMLRIPFRERDAWILSLVYTTDQQYLAGVPVPGVAYHWVYSDRLSVLLGVPFTSVRFEPIDGLLLEGTYVPIRRVRLRATYEVARPFRVYAGFDWAHDQYLRADRQDKDDELVYYEKRLLAGARFDLRHVGFELAGGYAFDRFYYEGEKFSDRDKNRIEVKSGPYLSARISFRF